MKHELYFFLYGGRGSGGWVVRWCWVNFLCWDVLLIIPPAFMPRGI